MSVEAFKSKLHRLARIDCDRESINMSGNIHAKYFTGNGAYLEGIAEANIPLVVSADLLGNVIATGNVHAKYFTGNGAYLEGIAEASIPSVVSADLLGNVTATGNVNAKYFIGDGSNLTGIKIEIPPNITFDNVNINKSITIGQNSTKILNVHTGVIKSEGNSSKNYELLTYNFPLNSFVSNNVIVFTSVKTEVESEVNKHFIVSKNYGYNQLYNLVYIQARDILDNISEPYSINVLGIEYS